MTFLRVSTGLGLKMQLLGSRMMLGASYGVGGSFATFAASFGSGLEGAPYMAVLLFSSSAAFGGTGYVIRGAGRMLHPLPKAINKISQERFNPS